jgi:hypothetical protein
MGTWGLEMLQLSVFQAMMYFCHFPLKHSSQVVNSIGHFHRVRIGVGVRGLVSVSFGVPWRCSHRHSFFSVVERIATISPYRAENTVHW